MKKETLIIIFYVVYFTWLSAVTYLVPDTRVLNLFTGGIGIFYFIFLREQGDLFFFLLGCSLVPLAASTKFSHFEIKFSFDTVAQIPIWLYLAWGTTFVALRKLYLIVSK